MGMTVVQELGGACRRLLRRPVSAAGIIVTLTLGIAISVSMFSVLYAVVLRALPYDDGERIVVINTENPEQGVPRAGLTTTEARDALSEVPGFEYTAYYHGGQYTFTGGDEPLFLGGALVSPDYFSVFGVQAAMGRTLIGSDFVENRSVIVLGHAAWMQMTGGDTDAIGRTLTFQEGNFELVGVLPDWFNYPGTALLYLPQRTTADGLRFQSAIGRLAPGTSPALAEETLQARLAGVHEVQGLPDRGWRIQQVVLIDQLVAGVRETLLAVFAVALLVLLVACSAAASLVSIRLEQRNEELAVRRALGATRTRVTLDVTLELMLLIAIATLAGVSLAYLAVEIMRPMAANALPRAGGIGIDRTVLLFAGIASLGSVVLSGVGPLMRALRADPAQRLRGGIGHEVAGGRRIALLPTIGIALSTTALVTALALAVSLIQLGNVDPGFRSQNIAALELNRRPTETGNIDQFLELAIDELQSVPGVRGVTVVGAFPPSSRGSGGTPMEVRAQTAEAVEPIMARTRWAWDGYHRLLDIPLSGGDDISERHTRGTPGVAVINETLARQAFRGADPIGEVLMVAMGSQSVPFDVVGVSADTRNAGLEEAPEPEITFAMRQAGIARVTLLVDSAIMPANWMRTLEEALWRIDADQPILRSYSLTDDLDNQTRRLRFFAVTTGWFAVLALLLGAAGINAVVAAMQRRRAREIGLRMALGAAPRHAATLVLGNAARIVGLGLGMGTLLAGLVLLWLRDNLFGLSAGALWALEGLTALVLIAAGLVAAAWPAWRASRIAPMRALRYE
jgi:putative ABC transport system permease protein